MEHVGFDNNGLLLGISAALVARALGLTLLRRRATGLVSAALGLACVAWITATRPSFAVPDPATASVLVTGASRGVGLEVARAYADKGYYVYAGVRSEKDGAALKDAGRIEPVLLDVTNPEHIAAAKAHIVADKAHRLMAIVANAGIITDNRPAELHDTDDYRSMINVNYLANVDLVQTFGHVLRENGGRVIATSSLLANALLPDFAPYAASKVALEGFLTSFRRDTLKMGSPVAVSILRIGLTDTDMARTSGHRAPSGPAEIKSPLPKDDPAMKQFFDNLEHDLEVQRKLVKERTVPVSVVIPAFLHALEDPHPLSYYYTTGVHKVLNGLIHLLPDHVIDILYMNM